MKIRPIHYANVLKVRISRFVTDLITNRYQIFLAINYSHALFKIGSLKYCYMRLNSPLTWKNTTCYFILFGLFLILNGCLFWVTETKEDMVLIPEGSFTMGFNTANRSEWGDIDEEPVHEVFLSSYYIDRYEVNASNFSDFLNSYPDRASRYIQTGAGVTIEKTTSRMI